MLFVDVLDPVSSQCLLLAFGCASAPTTERRLCGGVIKRIDLILICLGGSAFR